VKLQKEKKNQEEVIKMSKLEKIRRRALVTGLVGLIAGGITLSVGAIGNFLGSRGIKN